MFVELSASKREGHRNATEFPEGEDTTDICAIRTWYAAHMRQCRGGEHCS